MITPAPGSRTLITEIETLFLVVSSVIVIGVQLLTLAVISTSMIADLRERAAVTADEIQALMAEPLYNVDDSQATRIGEALLSSGRISGIELESAVSGVLLAMPGLESDSRIIAPQLREITLKGLPLGSVRLYFSAEDIQRTRMRYLLAGILVVGAVTGAILMASRFLVRKRFNQPMAMIARGVDTIAAGSYNERIPDTAFSDLNLLVQVINDMSAKISAKNKELRDMNSWLEDRVEERTRELQKSLQDLRQAQDLLIESEKISALGHLSAGMAHELNTPLGAIVSSNRLVSDFLDSKLYKVLDYIAAAEGGQYLFFRKIVELAMSKEAQENGQLTMQRRKKVRAVTEALEAQQVLHSGELSEIIVDLGLSVFLDQFIEELRDERSYQAVTLAAEGIIALRMSEIISIAAGKASTVVSALRSYISPETSERDALVKVDEDIKKVLVLMHNMLKYGIQTHCDFGGVEVVGSSDELSQVWLNLIRNAAQAMEFKGELYITTRMVDGFAEITIQDNGCGIPAEIIDRIFEPFFTTKKQGEGMGLGLDICKRIIEGSGGTITVQSGSGRTEFKVRLPGVSKKGNSE